MSRIEDLLKQLLRENPNNNYSQNNLDISDVQLPSPIKRRQMNIAYNIINNLKVEYDKLILNTTPFAKDLLDNNRYTEPSLHTDKEGLKNNIRLNLRKLNSDFEVIRITNEERLMTSESFSFEDASIINNLENLWEKDRKSMSFLEMAIKWKITIPDGIELDKGVVATYRNVTDYNTIIYDVNKYNLRIEIDVIY